MGVFWAKQSIGIVVRVLLLLLFKNISETNCWRNCWLAFASASICLGLLLDRFCCAYKWTAAAARSSCAILIFIIMKSREMEKMILKVCKEKIFFFISYCIASQWLYIEFLFFISCLLARLLLIIKSQSTFCNSFVFVCLNAKQNRNKNSNFKLAEISWDLHCF